MMKAFQTYSVFAAVCLLLCSCQPDVKVKPAHTWILMEPMLGEYDLPNKPFQMISSGYLIISANADTGVFYHLMNHKTGEPNNPDTLYSFSMNTGLNTMIQQLDLFAEKTPSNLYLDPLPHKDAIYCGTRYLLLQVQDKSVVKYYGLRDYSHGNVLDTLLDTYRNSERSENLKTHPDAIEYTGLMLNEFKNKAELRPFFFPEKPKNRWKLKHVQAES